MIHKTVKIKGTEEELQAAEAFLKKHPHVARHIRHIEIWIPSWNESSVPKTVFETRRRANAPRVINRAWLYKQSKVISKSTRATLQSIARLVHDHIPGAFILTINGGDAKKPEPVLLPDGIDRLARMSQVNVLNIRGAWNVIRSYKHWYYLNEALPNLNDARIDYARAKPAGHATVGRILSRLSPSIKTLHLTLENFHYDWGFFRGVKESGVMSGVFARRSTAVRTCIAQRQAVAAPPCGVRPTNGLTADEYHHLDHAEHTLPHLCRILGVAIMQLEVLSLTGRCCSFMFEIPTDILSQSHVKGSLKVLDIALKGCCSHSERKRRPMTMPTRKYAAAAASARENDTQIEIQQPEPGSEAKYIPGAHPDDAFMANALYDYSPGSIPDVEMLDIPPHGDKTVRKSNSNVQQWTRFKLPDGAPGEQRLNEYYVENINFNRLYDDIATRRMPNTEDPSIDIADEENIIAHHSLDDNGDHPIDHFTPSINGYIRAYGLANTGFIVFLKAFEDLIYSIVQALEQFPDLHTIRVRFVELDSLTSMANPYWEVKDGLVYGLWSETIAEALERIRPNWKYAEKLNKETPDVEMNVEANGQPNDESNGQLSLELGTGFRLDAQGNNQGRLKRFNVDALETALDQAKEEFWSRI